MYAQKTNKPMVIRTCILLFFLPSSWISMLLVPIMNYLRSIFESHQRFIEKNWLKRMICVQIELVWFFS